MESTLSCRLFLASTVAGVLVACAAGENVDGAGTFAPGPGSAASTSDGGGATDSTATTTSPSPSTSGDSGASEGGPADCGNGVVDGTEDCDGEDLGGNTCVDYGFSEGVLACAPDCVAVTQACSTCGDGVVALAEACDGAALGGSTCESLGFGGGVLACSADCSALDPSGCVALATCGNGALDATEQCDGANLGGSSCQALGFDGGTLSCTAACTIDAAGCSTDPETCIPQGDLCLLDPQNPASGCCPPGVQGAVLGICAGVVCV
jgi:hypothetical protein